MKKLTVAVVIVGAFIIFSLLNRPSSSVALVPASTADTGAVANAVTPTTGASNTPPTPTASRPSVVPTNTPPVASSTQAPTATTASVAYADDGANSDDSIKRDSTKTVPIPATWQTRNGATFK